MPLTQGASSNAFQLPSFGHLFPSQSAMKARRVALVGTLPPRRCGIATFTADVKTSFDGIADWTCDVVVVTDDDNSFDSASALIEIRHNEPSDYIRAANRLNAIGVDIVSLQHEFGIFGGFDGDYILSFIAALKCPCIVTLHTVIEVPTLGQRLVTAALLRQCAHVIVMAKKGLDLLVEVYGADPALISVCAHGTPDQVQTASSAAKPALDLDNRLVLLTFGLLSPGKGLDTMIRAMPAIVEQHPDAIYVILGATHPHLVQREGEAYRNGLIALASSLGVQDHVRFEDAFVDKALLLDYLVAADIYVTPYLNEAQITSGTLAYAIALGKPVISTPYWHAAEVIDESFGALVDFGDIAGFSEAVSSFLDNPDKLQCASDAAYATGRDTIWARSGERYAAIFSTVLEARPGDHVLPPRFLVNTTPRLDGVLRATDSCGIYQHSSYGIANRAHGYCIDDNVRGLILVGRMRGFGEVGAELDTLERTFGAFVQHAWNPETQRFRNFMSYDRSWLEATGSQDSNGRAFWALGETALYAADPQLRIWAHEMAKQVGVSILGLTSLRARCFSILGAAAFLSVDEHDKTARNIIAAFAEDLMERYETHGHAHWQWFESSLSYDNARLPQALIVAGMALHRADWLACGYESLAWLAKLQLTPNGYFRAIGSETSGKPYAPPTKFDQQPIEAFATIDAALSAFEASRNTKYLTMAKTAHAWFFGENDVGQSLCDAKGGCFDGLTPDGLNKNQGAESILALQLANVAMAKVSLSSISQGRRIGGAQA